MNTSERKQEEFLFSGQKLLKKYPIRTPIKVVTRTSVQWDFILARPGMTKRLSAGVSHKPESPRAHSEQFSFHHHFEPMLVFIELGPCRYC